jgi:hypothetical protein
MSARLTAILVAAMLCASSLPAAADEPGAGTPAAEEPALVQRPQQAAAKSALPSWLARQPRGPRLQVYWRTFDVAEMSGRRGRFHNFAADYYFISNILRAGAGLEGGWDTGPQNNFLISTDLRLGVQWPARITPALDAVLGLGVLRLDVLHDSLVCFAYQLGLEANIHFFVHPLVYASVIVGWRRLSYRQPGNLQVQSTYIYNDTLSLGVGLGF